MFAERDTLTQPQYATKRSVASRNFCTIFDTFLVNEKLEIEEDSSTFVFELTRNIHLRIIHCVATLHITSVIRKFVNHSVWFLFLVALCSAAYSKNQENKSRDKFIVYFFISKTKTFAPAKLK